MIRSIILTAALALATAAQAAEEPKLALSGNALVYKAPRVEPKTMRRVTGRIQGPTLGPDGRTLAFVETKADEDGHGFSVLWLCDGPTAACRTLIDGEHAESDDPKLDLTRFETPKFSLNGGFLYILSAGWPTSGAVQQINLKTGAVKFIIDANRLDVIRKGPYAGYLIVERHRDGPAPKFGTDDPTYVVRPDGGETLMIPRSAADDGGKTVRNWLKAHGAL